MTGNLKDLLLASAARYAEQPALWVDGCHISYRDLIHQSYGIANALQPITTHRTAVFADRHFEAYAGIVGALLAGHTYVPLNPQHPSHRLASILHRADVGALVIGQRALAACRDLISQASPMTVVIPDGAPPGWANHARKHHFVGFGDLDHRPFNTHVDQQEGAYLLFTSGSTGTPKGVLVNHENVMAYLRTARQRYGLTPNDRATQLFDLTFDLSVHDLFVTWGSGATLYCPSDAVRKAPYRFVQQHELTCWFSTPATVSLMSRLHMIRPNVLPTLRWSLFCGEALPKALAQEWMSAAPHSLVENLYGPTEATIAITGFRIPAKLEHLPDILPIGQPFPDQEAMIVEEHSLNETDDGELLLSGSQVTEGYWRQPLLTTERFVYHGGRWLYRTGDHVIRTEHGLCFQGRLDRQVKIRGNRVELFEVEMVLRLAAACDAIAAVPWPVENGIINGIVGLVAEDSASNEAIMAECERLLPAYMRPTRLVRVREWPLNSNTKTDYAALLAILSNEAGRGV